MIQPDIYSQREYIFIHKVLGKSFSQHFANNHLIFIIIGVKGNCKSKTSCIRTQGSYHRGEKQSFDNLI